MEEEAYVSKLLWLQSMKEDQPIRGEVLVKSRVRKRGGRMVESVSMQSGCFSCKVPS
jgi:hypothetical protein